jgi:predicted O-linked N-acetylglucosamine transferase (SPINDLY family)
LRLHHRIDVALDSFPSSGLTTVLNAAQMGEPSITLASTTSVSRTGGAALNNLGHAKFVAQSPKQYVQLATAMARNLRPLSELRGRLRGQLAKSPLADAAGLARAVEDAYRQMWRTWSQGG